MNGTITSKNFKVAFTVNETGGISGAKLDGTSSEARKYCKTISVYAPGDISSLTLQLTELEAGLRKFVLARIGG